MLPSWRLSPKRQHFRPSSSLIGIVNRLQNLERQGATAKTGMAAALHGHWVSFALISAAVRLLGKDDALQSPPDLRPRRFVYAETTGNI